MRTCIAVQDFATKFALNGKSEDDGGANEVRLQSQGIESLLLAWASYRLRVSLVRVLAEMCEFDQATDVANAIDLKHRPTTLETIATAMEQVGMVEGARQLLEQADELLGGEEQLWRKVQKEFCDALVAGEFDRAIELAEGIGNEAAKSEALKRIAMALVKAKEFERATKLVAKITSYKWQVFVLTDMAMKVADLSMAEKAKELLQMAWQASCQANDFRSLWSVATTSANLGFDDLTVEYIGQIIDLMAE